ncbi:MAG: elongation factor P [bacterium]
MPSQSISDLKLGTTITWRDEPYVVIKAQHVQMGRGGAILRTKLKNLINGNVLDQTFKGGDKVESAELQHTKASFLYTVDGQCTFMDSETYDQFSLDADQLGHQRNFLSEGQEVDVLTFNNKPVAIDLPKKIEMTVAQTPEGIRGDTAQGSVTKEATTENGYVVKVPLFIKNGDKIRVNTETGDYVERV